MAAKNPNKTNRDVPPETDGEEKTPQETDGQAAKPVPRARQSAAPTCPYHERRCKANHSDAYFTRYYCPVEGCQYMVKQPRPQMRTRLHADEDFSAR